MSSWSDYWLFILLGGGCALMLTGGYFFTPVEVWPVSRFSLILTPALFLPIVFWYLRVSRGERMAERVMLSLIALPASAIFMLGAVVTFNGVFDNVEPIRITRELVGHQAYSGGVVGSSRLTAIDPAWTVRVEHWHEAGRTVEIELGEQHYRRLLASGDPLRLEIGPGALGFQWSRDPQLRFRD